MRKKDIDLFADLIADYTYHVYNRSNNKELIFRDDADRLFFLKQFDKFLSPYVKTYSYALLGNHFHLTIQVRSLETIEQFILKIPKKDLTKAQEAFLKMPKEERSVSEVVSSQFMRLFTSYSRKFNNKYNRSGNLFYRRFKRIEVQTEHYFTYLIYYHHINCRKHGLMHDFTNYRWSSYQSMLSQNPTKLEREAVLKWFGGKDAFLSFHLDDHDLDHLDFLFLED